MLEDELPTLKMTAQEVIMNPIERELLEMLGEKMTDEEMTDYIADWFPEVDKCYLEAIMEVL
jgi:hypothetical protein